MYNFGILIMQRRVVTIIGIVIVFSYFITIGCSVPIIDETSEILLPTKMMLYQNVTTNTTNNSNNNTNSNNSELTNRDKRGFGSSSVSKAGQIAGQKAIDEINHNKRVAAWSAQVAVDDAVGRNYLHGVENTKQLSAAYTSPVTKQQVAEAFKAVKAQQDGAQINAAVIAGINLLHHHGQSHAPSLPVHQHRPRRPWAPQAYSPPKPYNTYRRIVPHYVGSPKIKFPNVNYEREQKNLHQPQENPIIHHNDKQTSINEHHLPPPYPRLPPLSFLEQQHPGFPEPPQPHVPYKNFETEPPKHHSHHQIQDDNSYDHDNNNNDNNNPGRDNFIDYLHNKMYNQDPEQHQPPSINNQYLENPHHQHFQDQPSDEYENNQHQTNNYGDVDEDNERRHHHGGVGGFHEYQNHPEPPPPPNELDLPDVSKIQEFIRGFEEQRQYERQRNFQRQHNNNHGSRGEPHQTDNHNRFPKYSPRDPSHDFRPSPIDEHSDEVQKHNQDYDEDEGFEPDRVNNNSDNKVNNSRNYLNDKNQYHQQAESNNANVHDDDSSDESVADERVHTIYSNNEYRNNCHCKPSQTRE